MDRNLRILPAVLTLTVLALVPAAGLAGELWTAGATTAPGPELAVPPGWMARSPSAENRAAESLVEMPIAGTIRPMGEMSGGQTLSVAVQPEASPLATAETVADRSVQLEQVAQQADRRIQHGFELAGRGAFFAARSEFLGALRLVAEGLDAERQHDVHSRALAAALSAMKEAEDFLPSGSRREADLDLAGIIAVHTTPVLKDAAEKATPMTALRCYHTFAQEQLAVAAGREVAGSMALHAMGKLHAALAQKKSTLIVAPESKAVVFFQASLLVCRRNYMAANDLGVLLAQCGRYADAQAMLEHSLSLHEQSSGLHNLTVVYQQLGQPALAQRAAQRATMLQQTEIAQRRASAGSANESVRWVDSQTFAQASTTLLNSPGTAPSAPVGRPATAVVGRPATAVVGRPATTPWSASETKQPTPAVGPAPTPAAAQRMMWGEPSYQR